MAFLVNLPIVPSAGRRVANSGLAFGLFATLSACGEPLVDQQFRGKSLWQFSGGLEISDSKLTSSTELRIAMFWNPKGDNGTDPTQYVEQLSSGLVGLASTPFLLNMYEYPGAEHIARTPSGLSRGFAVGRILVYLDDDHNGRYSSSDSFIGVLPNRVFLYVPEELPAWATPTGGVLPAGIYPIALPQRCDAQVTPGNDPANCGVKLGTSCKIDSGCGTNGVCLRETDVPWPTGYCAVADSASTVCRPSQSSYYGVPKYGLSPSDVKGYYLQSCQADLDCAKSGAGRNAGLYVCDKGLHACVPNAGGKLPVGGMQLIEPFCMGGS